jgi:hypothetical protein
MTTRERSLMRTDDRLIMKGTCHDNDDYVKGDSKWASFFDGALPSQF